MPMETSNSMIGITQSTMGISNRNKAVVSRMELLSNEHKFKKKKKKVPLNWPRSLLQNISMK